ncbi:ribonuclease J [Candidatus Falkowbacteria bacterium]|nr:ribonuclease J [Candidatus Falkowbacteria bacterium]
MIQHKRQRPNYPRRPRPTFNRGTFFQRKKIGSANALRIMVLGGLEEVGRNMTVLEYGDDIVIIDMGLQFPEEDMPGIDYIIPDITYLKSKAKNIRGVIITHGHYDHIGAISHLIPELGDPPVLTAKLTAGLIKKRHEEFNKTPLKIGVVDPDKDRLRLGKFEVEFFRVNHSIPDSFGVVLHTPVGTVVHTGDFKIDLSPINDKPIDLNRLAQIGGRGVLALMADSTDAEHRGHQISEGEITSSIETIFQQATGRIIVGTFASLINRIQQIISIAEKYNRKVYLDGRSMNANIEIARQLGYLKIKPGTLVEEGDVKRLPDEKIVILGTGAQGEKSAVLKRIANREHKFLSVKPGDSIVFSSSVIPGNERTIQNLKDTFYRQGAKVYHYQMMDIHAGGHAKQEDLKLIIRLLMPKYFIPISANHYMLRIHGELAESVGIPKENIFIAMNGQVMEFVKGDNQKETTGRLTEEKVPTEYIMVDGLGVGDVSNIVLRDRRMMSEDGMFVIIATVKKRGGELIGSPDIISRGFVYMKESKKLIEEARTLVRKICGKKLNTAFDAMELKNKLRDSLGQFLYQRTKRRPMVLPVVIEV